MIHVGVDLHRAFCYMTAVDTSGRVLQRGRVENRSDCLRNYFAGFREAPEVAFEACSFWPAFVDAVEGMVGRLVMVHPQRVKAISSAKLKNDRVDSETLAHLLRANLLPESWIANREVRELRQQARLRVELGRDRAHVKQRIHAVLHQQGSVFPARTCLARPGEPGWPTVGCHRRGATR
jgi:transposase